jgi:hypothetical protein
MLMPTTKSKQARIEELEEELAVLDEKWLATIDSWLMTRHAQDTVAAVLYCQDEMEKGNRSYRDARLSYDPYRSSIDPYKMDYGPRDLREAESMFSQFAQKNASAARGYMAKALAVLQGVSAAIEESSLKAII